MLAIGAVIVGIRNGIAGGVFSADAGDDVVIGIKTVAEGISGLGIGRLIGLIMTEGGVKG